MLQNARVTAFTVSELLRENQQRGKISPTQSRLTLHYNGSNSFLFGNATKIHQFKARNIEIKDYTQCF